MDLTPIVSALQELAAGEEASLHMPGHKGGRFPGFLSRWLGRALDYDQTEVGPLDSLHAPDGPIRQSENLVASLYGVRQTCFTTNGSSAGLGAAMLASAPPGAEIIVPRDAHKAVLAGIILGDFYPHFISPLRREGFELGVDADSLAYLLKRHPQTEAAVLLHPTYEGLACDLDSLTRLTGAAGCRVVVDEAHGAHFPFHPALPASAVSKSVDWVVQSAHKTLTALTGAAWVHGVAAEVNMDLLRSRLNLVQSTSPSWLLLGSLDLAQQELRLRGKELLAQAMERARELAAAIESRTPFTVWRAPRLRGLGQDPLKINLLTAAAGYRGYEVDRHLEAHGFFAEMAKGHSLLLMLTLADAHLDIGPLVECLAALPRRRAIKIRVPPAPPLPPLVMRPRSAYFADIDYVKNEDALGRVAARSVYFYPPGAPLVYPGEELNQEILAYVRELSTQGGHLQGLQEDAWPVVAAE